MSRRLRRESMAYPYSEEFGAVGDRVAEEMFGAKGGSDDYSIDPRTGQLVRAAKIAPPDHDPRAAAEEALRNVRKNMLDSGANVVPFIDMTGASYTFSVPRSITEPADGHSAEAGRRHQVTAIRLQSTTDRTASRYVFTTHEFIVRGVARLQGWTSKVLYQPE